MEPPNQSGEGQDTSEFRAGSFHYRTKFDEYTILELFRHFIKNKQKTDEPPPKVENFLRYNYRYLTIAGVFMALVVYFSQLTKNPSEPIIIGMIGGAIMFGISLMIIFKNVSVGMLWSILYGSHLYTAMYFTIFLSLIFVSLALATFFSRYPSVAFDTVDRILALAVFSTLIAIYWIRPQSDSSGDDGGWGETLTLHIPLGGEKNLEINIRFLYFRLIAITLLIIFIVIGTSDQVNPPIITPIIVYILDYATNVNSLSFAIIVGLAFGILVAILTGLLNIGLSMLTSLGFQILGKVRTLLHKFK